MSNTLDELIDWLLNEPAYTPADMRAKIQALITEARIDEVEGIINMPPDFDDFDVYLPYRLTQLKDKL